MRQCKPLGGEGTGASSNPVPAECAAVAAPEASCASSLGTWSSSGIDNVLMKRPRRELSAGACMRGGETTSNEEEDAVAAELGSAFDADVGAEGAAETADEIAGEGGDAGGDEGSDDEDTEAVDAEQLMGDTASSRRAAAASAAAAQETLHSASGSAEAAVDAASSTDKGCIISMWCSSDGSSDLMGAVRCTFVHASPSSTSSDADETHDDEDGPSTRNAGSLPARERSATSVPSLTQLPLELLPPLLQRLCRTRLGDEFDDATHSS